MPHQDTNLSPFADLRLSNADAIYLNEVLRPAYRGLIAARYDLEHPFPHQSDLVRQMITSLMEVIFDAEIGTLNARPEKRLAILQELAA